MYEELVQRLHKRIALTTAGSPLQDDLREAADAIEELQKAVYFHKYNSEFWEDKYNSLADEKWIPVTERLPERTGKYLVCGQWRGKPVEMWVCELIAFDKIKGWANETRNPAVTHWMPLPEPPKEET